MTILLSALWILWTSRTSWPSGGRVELWHNTQNLVSRRPPPWIASGSWQPLQAAVVTTSRVTELAVEPIAVPFGTRSNVGLATGADRSGSAVNNRVVSPEIWIPARVVRLSWYPALILMALSVKV